MWENAASGRNATSKSGKREQKEGTVSCKKMRGAATMTLSGERGSRRKNQTGAGQPAGHGHDGKKEEDADEKKEGTGAEGGGGKKE